MISWRDLSCRKKTCRKEESHLTMPEVRKQRHKFARSVHVRHVDSGSCNGCEWETMAVLNPVYDGQRFGVDFVASPRHADVLLVTGGVTRNLEAAVVRTYNATPCPKRVVAVGACACGGGMIGATYANAGGLDEIIPVTVYVPGCPPRPQAILDGILAAMEQPGERARADERE